MLLKLSKAADRYEELTDLLSHPETLGDSKKFQTFSKEQSKLSPFVDIFHKYQSVIDELEGNTAIVQDPEEDKELKDMAKEEIPGLKKRLEELEEETKILFLPKDDNDEKNVILEIRAGTGGDEAALFVADLFKMYKKYADLNSWKTELMDSHITDQGGFKEISISIDGKNVYSKLKFEAGTHRVQRVPVTETQGRVHTSAVTVAILIEPDEIDVEINQTDLRIDTYRSQGAGGQHVNTTDSAIRITHIPTGVVVACQEERSQTKNKAKAMKYLKAKLFEIQEEAIASKEASARRAMVGSGDRSERIRTYNFPQGRITDHRIGLTLYKLEEILSSGNISQLVEGLLADNQAKLLKLQETN